MSFDEYLRRVSATVGVGIGLGILVDEFFFSDVPSWGRVGIGFLLSGLGGKEVVDRLLTRP